jgi:hypothetical protein
MLIFPLFSSVLFQLQYTVSSGLTLRTKRESNIDRSWFGRVQINDRLSTPLLVWISTYRSFSFAVDPAGDKSKHNPILFTVQSPGQQRWPSASIDMSRVLSFNRFATIALIVLPLVCALTFKENLESSVSRTHNSLSSKSMNSCGCRVSM